jgi:exonuclease III
MSVARRSAVPVCLALLAALVISPRTAEAGGASPVRLRVAEFNVEYGGTRISFDKVVEAIERGGADVVAIEEGQAHIPRLAHELGWRYFSERLQVVSKLPLIDPPDSEGRYVLVEVRTGQVVALENVHLPSNPYGPYRVKRGDARSSVLRIENRLRVPAIEPFLDTAQTLMTDGIPVFLAGDFNAPSWRDWTERMVGVRRQIRYPVRWPVSLAVEDAGFVDSYRSLYPNVRRHPGLTWWADRPKTAGYPRDAMPQDRIDMIYATPDAEPTRSIIVGERGSPLADVGVDPWPSDHRSIVTTFRVMPAPMPTLVAVRRPLREQGRSLTVRFHAPPDPGADVAIVPPGGDVPADAIAEAGTNGEADGTVSFDTDGWTPGRWEAVLVDGSNAELSRVPLWIRAAGQGVEVSTSRRVFDVGDPIDVSWIFAPARRWDWIGIYRRGRDPRVAYYLLWAYTGATVEGTVSLDDDDHGPWPLRAGRYTVYLLTDDGYKALGGTNFRISA